MTCPVAPPRLPLLRHLPLPRWADRKGRIPPKTLGEILSAAFNLYKANAASLILIVAIVVVPLTFISSLFSGVVFEGSKHTAIVFGQAVEVVDRSFGFLIGGRIITALISVIISAVLQAAILRAAAQATIGDPVDPQESYRFGFKRLGSVILVSLLVGLAVAGGLILLVIPGLIFLIFLSVSVPVLIVENRRGRAALSRSWNLVKGHFWHAVGVIIVAGHHHGDRRRDHRLDRRERVGRAVDLLVDRHDHHRAVHVARLRAPVPGSAFAERGADRRHAQDGAGRGRRLRIAERRGASSRRPGPAPPAGPTGIGRRARERARPRSRG